MKYILSVFVTGLLCLHFILIILYDTGNNKPETLTRQSIPKAYCNPYFHQSWKLFVPPPKHQYKLYIRTRQDDTWSTWQDVLASILYKHRRNRLSGYEYPALIFGNSLIYTEQVLPAYSRTYDALPEQVHYKVLHHELRQWLLHRKISFSAFEALLVISDDRETRSYYFKNLH